jgi:23S rRNA pseudouridine2605 synthase
LLDAHGLPQSQHFRMRQRIAKLFDAVVGTCQQIAVDAVYDDRTNRDFAACRSRFRGFKRSRHIPSSGLGVSVRHLGNLIPHAGSVKQPPSLPGMIRNRTVAVMTGGKKVAADTGDRIAKVIARAGVCSRREAERLIADGRVALNGQVLDSPAVKVASHDKVTVDGSLIGKPTPTRLWRYHKPPGLVTTTRDEKGRATVFDRLPDDLPRVITVGRLDLNSEGLLLLTNDGALARQLELPKTGWVRRYRVRVRGRIDAAKLVTLGDGITIDGARYGPIKAGLEHQARSNAWLSIALREGRNREVRKLCEHFGWPVTRLIRVSFGPFQLGRLPRGGVAEVPARVIRQQLGGEDIPAEADHANHRRQT